MYLAYNIITFKAKWPSGLRRQFKALVFRGVGSKFLVAEKKSPPLSNCFFVRVFLPERTTFALILIRFPRPTPQHDDVFS